MTDKNKNNSNNKEKPVFDRQAFKDAIAFVESSGGKKLDNPDSSAAGRYHFLYRYIKNIPLLKGVSKREFINSPDLQEKVMDMAIDGKLPGFKSYEKHSANLKSKYNTTLRQDEIAALTHFLGAKGVENFLSDPESYKVPGKNASIAQYLNRYNSVGNNKSNYSDTTNFFKPQVKKAQQPKFPKYNSVTDETNLDVLRDSGLLRDERGMNNKVQDNTAVGSNFSKLNTLPQDSYSSQYGAEELINFTQQEQLGQLAYGGGLNNTVNKDELVEFNTGGSHEQNPLGGIPQGMGANGKMNTVEEGESKFAFDEGEYVFSDRITLDGIQLDSPSSISNNQYAEGGYVNGDCGGPGQPPCKKLVVKSKDDPRYKAYQDSLHLYNTHNQMNKYFRKNPEYFLNELRVKGNDKIISTYEDYEYGDRKIEGIDPIGYNEYNTDDYLYTVEKRNFLTGNVTKHKGEEKFNNSYRIAKFEKPHREVVVDGGLDFKKNKKKINRPEENKINPLTSPVILTNNEITNKDVRLLPNPEIDYYDVIKEVNSNFGSSRKQFRVTNKEELDRLFAQQKADESSSTGSDNRLIVKNKYKNNTNQHADGGFINNNYSLNTEPKIKNKKNDPPTEEPPRNLSSFIMNSDDKNLDNIYQNIHSNSNGSCLAGSLNCNTDYVAPKLGVKPIRSLINNNEDKINKYKINSRSIRGIGDYVENQSIDAWEIHEFLRGENLGSDFYTSNENTKYNKGIPSDLDYMSIPIGSIIGQGYSEGYYTSSKDGKDRNRHAMTVVGYDEKDGMPMVYDYGGLRRLDNLKALGSGNNKSQRITKITVPKGYEKYNRDYISSQNKNYQESLGFKENEDFKISFNSKKEPIKAIEQGVNEHAKNIALHYGVNKNVVEKLANHLPGISYEETKLNNNDGTSWDSILPTSVTDSWLGNNVLKPSGKALENVGTSFMNMFRDDDSKRKQDWEIELEAYKKYPKDKEKFKAYFNKLKSENSGDKGYSRLESSVGAFKIKDLSEYYKLKYKDRSNLYGANVSNKDELKNGSVAALSLLVEKYEKVKKMHPDLTDDQAIKLSVIGYSNASKMKSKDFVENYIKNNNLKDNKYEDIISYKYE